MLTSWFIASFSVFFLKISEKLVIACLSNNCHLFLSNWVTPILAWFTDQGCLIVTLILGINCLQILMETGRDGM